MLDSVESQVGTDDSFRGEHYLTRDEPVMVGHLKVTLIRTSRIAVRIGSEEYETNGNILRYEGRIWTFKIEGARRVSLVITKDDSKGVSTKPVPRSQRTPLRSDRCPGDSREKKPYKYA